MISIACSTTGGGANGHKVSALGTCIETAKRGRVIKSIKNPELFGMKKYRLNSINNYSVNVMVYFDNI